MLTHSAYQRGLSLTEVLVSTVVIAIGLLGAADVQLLSVTSNTKALFHTHANFVANDMIERIRLNPPRTGFEGLYGDLSSADVDCTQTPSRICETELDISADSCSAVEMVNYDLHSVVCGRINATRLQALLPNGELVVNCGAVACDTTESRFVQISWLNTAQDSSSTQSITMSY